MSARLHAFLTIFASLAGCLGAPFLVSVCRAQFGGSAEAGGWLIVLAPALFGLFVPAEILRRLLPAKCPQCGTMAYHAGQGPIDARHFCCPACAAAVAPAPLSVPKLAA